jgi:hypothetical protein
VSSGTARYIRARLLLTSAGLTLLESLRIGQSKPCAPAEEASVAIVIPFGHNFP